MTADDFRAWHDAMGYTYETGAKALGMSRSGYHKLLSGLSAIDKRTALACAAIAAGLRPWAPMVQKGAGDSTTSTGPMPR